MASFLEDDSTKRLLVYVDGKDLGAVRGVETGWGLAGDLWHALQLALH